MQAVQTHDWLVRSKLQVRLTIAGAGILASAAVATTVAIASAGEVSRGHEGATTKTAKAGADHEVFVPGNELDCDTIPVCRSRPGVRPSRRTSRSPRGWSTTSAMRAFGSCSARRAFRFNA